MNKISSLDHLSAKVNVLSLKFDILMGAFNYLQNVVQCRLGPRPHQKESLMLINITLHKVLSVLYSVNLGIYFLHIFFSRSGMQIFAILCDFHQNVVCIPHAN